MNDNDDATMMNDVDAVMMNYAAMMNYDTMMNDYAMMYDNA